MVKSAECECCGELATGTGKFIVHGRVFFGNVCDQCDTTKTLNRLRERKQVLENKSDPEGADFFEIEEIEDSIGELTELLEQ